MRSRKNIVFILLISGVVMGTSCKAYKGTSTAEGSVWENSIRARDQLTFLVQPIKSAEGLDTPYMTKEEFPVMDGSTASIPLGEAIYSFLTGADIEETKHDLKFNTTSEGYYNLMDGEADLLLVYEPSQLVLQTMEEKEIPLEFKPIGRDALVFIANERNPVDSLTREQITDIYKGKINNWSEVNGPDLEILPFQRPENSGSQTLLEKLVLSRKELMEGPQVIRPEDMGELIDVLAAYNHDNNALGYSVYFYAKNMYHKPDLKFIAIDGIMPSNESIQSGSYPYINDFYAVIRKEEPKDSNARRVYDWLTSEEAQDIAAQAGYVPITEPGRTWNLEEERGGSLALNMGETDYIVLHEKTKEEVIAGDTLLDKTFKPILHFPGKEIVTEGNLIWNESDLLVLQSVITLRTIDDYEFKTFGYELYDLKAMDYVTEKPYQKIEKTEGGFFICRNFGYRQEEAVIFDLEGKLVTEQIDSEGAGDRELVQIGDRILKVEQERLYTLDSTGSILSVSEFPYEGYLSELRRKNGDYSVQSDYAYLDRNGLKIIFDQDGRRVPVQKFLAQTNFITDPSELWITHIAYDLDGGLIVGGYLEGHSIIAKEDGTVLFNREAPRGRYLLSLYPGGSVITDVSGEKNSLLFIKPDGTLMESGDSQCLREMNQSVVFLEESGFTVYNLENGEEYRIEDRSYGTEYFMPAETQQYGEIYSYNRTGEENDVVSWYKNILELKGYAQIKEKTGGYFIIENEGIDFVVDEKGIVWYKGEEGEVIQGLLLAEELYIYSEQGNYSVIKDLNGVTRYRQYSSKLSDD